MRPTRFRGSLPGYGETMTDSPGSSEAAQPTREGPDRETHTRTQAEQADEELQAENAGTSLDQPSDDAE